MYPMTNENTVSKDGRKQRLRNLLDEAEAMKSTVEANNKIVILSKVNEIIHETDKINKEASVTSESAAELQIESNILLTAHQVVGKVMDCSFKDYDETVYANAIVKCVQSEGDLFWERMGASFFKCCKTAKFQPTLLGSFDRVNVKDEVEAEVEVEGQAKGIQSKKKTAKPSSSKVSTNVAVQPESIRSLVIVEEDNGGDNFMSKEILNLCKANGGQPIPLYRLIIDPESFSNTVFYVFQLSCLFKDGKIAIDWGRDGHPVVRLPNKEEEESKGKSENTNNGVLSFNMDKWKKMIKFYNIKKAILPPPHDFN